MFWWRFKGSQFPAKYQLRCWRFVRVLLSQGFMVLWLWLGLFGTDHWDYTRHNTRNTKHYGNILQTFYKHSTNILQTFYKHSGNILETFWKHSENILQTFCKHYKETFCKHSAKLLLKNLLSILSNILQTFLETLNIISEQTSDPTLFGWLSYNRDWKKD